MFALFLQNALKIQGFAFKESDKYFKPNIHYKFTQTFCESIGGILQTFTDFSVHTDFSPPARSKKALVKELG